MSICSARLSHRQLRRHIWPPITARVSSSLGPKGKETLGAKYGKSKMMAGGGECWSIHRISEHHLESLLILPYQRHRHQTEILKFMELTESQEPLLAIASATWEIPVYITWMRKYTLFQFPAMPKLNRNAR